MIKSVIWSERSKKDIEAIKKFYDQRNGSVTYSKKLLKTFKDCSDLISKFPQAARNTNVKNIKGFIILDYIIFYEILETHILILTIWDTRRDPAQLKEILG